MASDGRATRERERERGTSFCQASGEDGSVGLLCVVQESGGEPICPLRFSLLPAKSCTNVFG